jgi:myosin heavy subunit
VNSFEQLCINYCNEKLQYHFNEHIFKMEQDLYAKEGINIADACFVDNQPTLDLLEAKAVGIFSMCDEEINVPRGSDEGMLQKIYQKHCDGKHPNCLRPSVKDHKDFLRNFGILHYAGPVFYDVTGFLEKNKDQLHVDIINVLRGSSSFFVQKMFPPAPVEDRPTGGGKGGAKLKTLGGQFKTQLNDLIVTLNSTFPHFVRCMKPNDDKQANNFKASRMQDQLRYAGLLEVCRIRKLGYPVRRPFEEFYRRFRCCDLACQDLDSLLASLSTQKILKKSEWAKGRSRVFMRTLQSAELEQARDHALVAVATLVQKMARGMLARFKYKYWRSILINVAEAIAKREEAVLKTTIDMCYELPWGGAHLEVIKNAKVLLLRVREENKVINLLQTAIAGKELNALKGAVDAARTMDPPFNTPLALEAQAIIERLEAEIAAKAALVAAISGRNHAALVAAIAQAESMGYACNELNQAVSLKARIDQENDALAKLADAVQRRDLTDLNTHINTCTELGIDGWPQVLPARALKDELLAEVMAEEKRQAERAQEEEVQRKALEAAQNKRQQIREDALKKLADAMESNDYEQVTGAVQEAIELGLEPDTAPELKSGQHLLKEKSELDELRNQILAAVNVLRMKSETGIAEADLVPLASSIEVAEKVCTEPTNERTSSFRQ